MEQDRYFLINQVNSAQESGYESVDIRGAPSEGTPNKFRQYFAALTATFSAIAAGTVLGWTSPILDDLLAGKYGNIPLDRNQVGWTGAFATLGGMAMCIPTGFICDIIGRKKTLLSLFVPFTVGWLLLIFASNVMMLYFGRLITGMAAGACCIAAPLYTSEVAHKSLRGTLGSFFQLMVTIDQFINLQMLEDLQKRLNDWLVKRGKSISLFSHLKLFQPPAAVEENKENIGVDVALDNGSYEDLRIPQTKDDSENVKLDELENLEVVAKAALVDLNQLIRDPSARTSLERILCLSTYCFGNVTNTDNFKNSINQFITERKIPLYFAPEGKPTNGKALLKFKTYAFEISPKIQPICITVERPLIDVSVTTLGSSYFSDLFCYMFCPVTIYRLKFLQPLEQKCMSHSEFAEIVRKDIATNLKIEMTEYTSNDLAEYEKRKLVEEQQRAQNRYANRPIIPEIQRMSYQVKEVLPHVPFIVIYNDLCATRNVDTTINNVLEGRLHFTPEQTSATAHQFSPSSSPNAGASGSRGAATTTSPFSKSATERSKSYQERKEQLLADARKRYIEKHNLDIPI